MPPYKQHIDVTVCRKQMKAAELLPCKSMQKQVASFKIYVLRKTQLRA